MTAPTPGHGAQSELDLRAHRAAAAVRERSTDLPTDGLDAVVARARRPRTPAGLAVLVLVAVVAVGIRVLPAGDPNVELGGQPPPADEPDTSEPAENASPVDPTDPDPTVPSSPEAVEPSPGTSADPPPEGSPSPTPPDEASTQEPTAPPVDPSPTVAPSAQPAPQTSPLGQFSTESITRGGFPASTGSVAYLTDVRAGSHEGFDRIVLELDAADFPGYRVALVEPPITADGSGEVLTVAGEAFLEIALTPASGVRHDDSPQGYTPTYTGPDRVQGATANVTEVVRTGDFEATLGWVAGLRSATGFSVTELTDPARLVIDVRHAD